VYIYRLPARKILESDEGNNVFFKGGKKRKNRMSENDKNKENNGKNPDDDGSKKPVAGPEREKAESIENEKLLAEAAEAAAGAGADAGADVDDEDINPVDDLKQQLSEQNDRYLRLMAEFDNCKKRTVREYDQIIATANEKLISELIEVRENFERALKTDLQKNKPEEAPSVEDSGFFDGMKLIFSKFDAILTRNGLEPFGAAGEAFDPQLHDAMMKVPNQEIAEDHIVEVFEKGYTLKKRVIRHAKVIVSAGKPPQAEAGHEKK
jgi:molecular chaperone GrpE